MHKVYSTSITQNQFVFVQKVNYLCILLYSVQYMYVCSSLFKGTVSLDFVPQFFPDFTPSVHP